MRKINLNRVKSEIKSRVHHIVFIISLLSLSLLITWWSFFIFRSIENQHFAKKSALQYELKNLSLKYRLIGKSELLIKALEHDKKFEIVDSEEPESFAVKFPSESKTVFVKLKRNVVNKMEHDLKRKKFMVFGESGLLILIIVVSIIFLFKFIHLEKRSTKEMEEFWGRISHEIKTPIAGVKAFLQTLQNGSIDKDQIMVYTNLALKEIEKQEQLAENILTGSSFKSSLSLNIEIFDLMEFLKNYFNEHSLSLLNGKLVFNDEGYLSIFVNSDKHALKVILDNIIDNAGKYASPDLLLNINIKKSGKSVTIRIRDNGPGIEGDKLENIFRAYKFMKGELPDTRHGTGMGLFISRKLARRMGGDLNAIGNGEGNGATFELELPLG